MKQYPRIGRTLLIIATIVAMVLFLVDFLTDPQKILVPYTKTVLIPGMEKEVYDFKIDSVQEVAAKNFEKQLAYELSKVKPEIREKIIEVFRTDTLRDTIEVIYTETILYDTLDIYGNDIFNKYLVGAKTINYPPLSLKLKRFENNFVYRDTIYVTKYTPKWKKAFNWTIKGFAAYGALRFVESIK